MAKLDQKYLVKVMSESIREAEEARKDRIKQNQLNMAIFLGQQDWSHKTEDQSTEFLPKLATAAEQTAAFIKRGLVGQGDWFSVQVAQGSPISGSDVRTILQFFLQDIHISFTEKRAFPTIISDAVKIGLLESLVILKIHGCIVEEPFYSPQANNLFNVETREPIVQTRKVWKLRVDTVPSDEIYLDPSGLNLYKIHRVERDLYEVQEKADSGYYSKAAVKKIVEDMSRTDKDKPRASQRNQNESTKPQFRKKVVLDEYWGTILNEDGSVAQQNVYFVVANEKIVIKEPEPYPFWHGGDPFVIAPILRVPGSVWHKAVYDNASKLNMAMNEMYNLMFDGAMAAVWGIRQLHADWLEDTGQISDGIPPGTTLIMAPGAPPQGKVLESVFTTTVPPESMALFQLTNNEFQASAMTNDVRMGQLPSPGNVKATALQQAQQNTDMTFDSIIGDIENEVIEKALSKIWLTLLQNVDDMATEDVIKALGIDAAFAIAKMTPAQRFVAFGNNKFTVSGLSATLAKAGDFQKMMALMQVVGQNPFLMQAFFQKFSPDKIIEAFLKFLNINPASINQAPEDQGLMQQRMKEMPQFMQMMGQQMGNGGSAPGIGGNGGSLGADQTMNGEIHQNAEPTGGY